MSFQCGDGYGVSVLVNRLMTDGFPACTRGEFAGWEPRISVRGGVRTEVRVSDAASSLLFQPLGQALRPDPSG